MPHAPRLTAAMCAHGRSLGDPRLAPDGGRLAFLAGGGGRARLVVLDAHGGPEVVLTSDPPPVRAGAHGGGVFDWTPDGRALVYAAVDGCLWLQGADGGPPRQISDRGPAFSPAVAPDGSRVAYVVDAHHVAVARLDPGGPWPARLSVGADFCFDPAWSPDGEWVAWHEWDVPAMPWDDSRIVARPATAATGAAGAGEVVTVAGGRGRQPTAVSQPRWSPDGTRLGFLCDAGGWLNLWVAPGHLNGRAHPLLLEPHEHGGPAWGPGQRSWAWSPDGSAVALCRNQDGFGSLQLVDAATGAAHRLATGVHGGLSWAGQRLAAVRSDATTPTEVVCYLGADLGRRRTLAVGPVAGLATGSSPPTLVRWRGEDGGEVPGRLHRPTRPALGDPPPLLAWVHGGPTGQAEAGFDPRLAYWLDRGWAVLVPDHRGSTGHGRAFAQALAGRWGELDVADVAAGLRAAAERGWGDGDRLVAMGSSAGGFTVLNLLATHPSLCAAGVDRYGVVDLFGLEESTHRFEAHYLRSLIGSLPEAADRYRDRSPIDRAERITAPLLILHGEDDAVVPPAQSRALADRLAALGRTVELHLYRGEGHGWDRPESVVDELERTESFLRRHVVRRRVGGSVVHEAPGVPIASRGPGARGYR